MRLMIIKDSTRMALCTNGMRYERVGGFIEEYGCRSMRVKEFCAYASCVFRTTICDGRKMTEKTVVFSHFTRLLLFNMSSKHVNDQRNAFARKRHDLNCTRVTITQTTSNASTRYLARKTRNFWDRARRESRAS